MRRPPAGVHCRTSLRSSAPAAKMGLNAIARKAPSCDALGPRPRCPYCRGMHRFLRIALLAGPLLAGCGAPLDNEQLRLCRRVLPALNPESTEIRETRASAAQVLHGIRIEYTTREP